MSQSVANATCFTCSASGKPKGSFCNACRVITLEKQNRELIEKLNSLHYRPEPKETLECKECNEMTDRINQLSLLLTESHKEKIALMNEYQQQIDKVLSLNNKLMEFANLEAREEEELKKKLKEKEEALKNLKHQKVVPKVYQTIKKPPKGP